MQKFITGLAIGIATGTLIMAYSKSARELAQASKKYACQKIQNAKNDVEVKTEEIKDKTEDVKKSAEVKKPAVKKPATAKKAVASKEDEVKSEK